MEKRIISCCSRCRHAYLFQMFMHMCPAVRCPPRFFVSSLLYALNLFNPNLYYSRAPTAQLYSLHPIQLELHTGFGVFFLIRKIDFIFSGSGQRLLILTFCYSPNFLSANANVVFYSVAFDFYCGNEANSCIRRILDKIKIMK